MVGAPGAAEGGAGAGAIYLVPGARLAAAASGPVWASAVRVDGDAGGGLGAAMTLAAGDLDGDGRGDAALGCPGCGTGGAPPGEVWIVWGRDWP
ncbi:hypothetical protein L6R50_11165 [Myxococcota bacterium]|nr:hypothetical protein [Myxococcota bacterium]